MTMRRISFDHFIFNEQYEFTPWVISHYIKPTKRNCDFICNYIETHVDEMIRIGKSAPNIFVAAYSMLREAVKHKTV